MTSRRDIHGGKSSGRAKAPLSLGQCLYVGVLLIVVVGLMGQISFIDSFTKYIDLSVASWGIDESATNEKNPRPFLPLTQLVDSYALTDEEASTYCGDGLVYVKDTVLDPSLAFEGGRKIPKIVHLSSKSRCNDPIFAKNIDTWRLKGYSVFLHDDEAIKRLFDREWPEFPLLHKILACLPAKGAVMTDVWRILALWEYGGIYADFDTSPVPSMFNETTITPEDDAFFVVEVLGYPSQWFMVASPRHPMIYLTMMKVIKNLLNIQNLAEFPVVFTTGPGAVGEAFLTFNGGKATEGQRKFLEGHYVGVGNRTVRLVGSRHNENMYITRVIPELRDNNKKNDVYKRTNMTHLTHMGLKTDRKGLHCMEKLWNEEEMKSHNVPFEMTQNTMLDLPGIPAASGPKGTTTNLWLSGSEKKPIFTESAPLEMEKKASSTPPETPQEQAIPRRLFFIYVATDETCERCPQIHDVIRGEVNKGLQGLAKMINGTVSAYRTLWNGKDVVVDYLGNKECLKAVKEAEPKLLQYYLNEKNGAVKSDICRMAFMYLHGGYYFDNDLETLVPFVPRDGVTLSSSVGIDQESINVVFFIATPDNPIVRRGLDVMVDFYQGKRMRPAGNYGHLGPAAVQDAITLSLRDDPETKDKIELLHEVSLHDFPRLYPEVPRIWRRPLCSMVVHSFEAQTAYFRSRGDKTHKCM